MFLKVFDKLTSFAGSDRKRIKKSHDLNCLTFLYKKKVEKALKKLKLLWVCWTRILFRYMSVDDLSGLLLTCYIYSWGVIRSKGKNNPDQN